MDDIKYNIFFQSAVDKVMMERFRLIYKFGEGEYDLFQHCVERDDGIVDKSELILLNGESWPNPRYLLNPLGFITVDEIEKFLNYQYEHSKYPTLCLYYLSIAIGDYSRNCHYIPYLEDQEMKLLIDSEFKERLTEHQLEYFNEFQEAYYKNENADSDTSLEAYELYEKYKRYSDDRKSNLSEYHEKTSKVRTWLKEKFQLEISMIKKSMKFFFFPLIDEAENEHNLQENKAFFEMNFESDSYQKKIRGDINKWAKELNNFIQYLPRIQKWNIVKNGLDLIKEIISFHEGVCYELNMCRAYALLEEKRDYLIKLSNKLNEGLNPIKKTVSNDKIEDKTLTENESVSDTSKKLIQKVKTALKYIDAFKGYNIRSEKIMLDDDFKKLEEYVKQLIMKEEVPPNIQPIPKIKIPNVFIKHTFFLIHKELYSTKPKRDYFIDFLHEVFSQFKGKKSTTKTHFATPPTNYESDLSKMKEINLKMTKDSKM